MATDDAEPPRRPYLMLVHLSWSWFPVRPGESPAHAEELPADLFALLEGGEVVVNPISGTRRQYASEDAARAALEAATARLKERELEKTQ